MWHIEVTDTFAGEANYAWVKRSKTHYRGVRTLRMAAKEFAGWRGRVYTENHGDLIVMRPSRRSGVLQVAFLTWKD